MLSVSDRNVLFGVLAVQMDFLTPDRLRDALNSWVQDKDTPLSEGLFRAGDLSEADRSALEAMVDLHIAHHGDVRGSLASVLVGPLLRASLDEVADQDVRASVGRLALPPRTQPIRRIPYWVPGIAGTVVGGVLALALCWSAIERSRYQRDKAEARLEAAQFAEIRRHQEAQDSSQEVKKAVDLFFDLAAKHPAFHAAGAKDARRLILERALPFYERFANDNPDDPESRHDLAYHRFRIAMILDEIGKFEEALKQYNLAKRLYEELSKKDPDTASFREALGATWNNIAIIQGKLGRRDQAREAHAKSLEIRRTLLKGDPDSDAVKR